MSWILTNGDTSREFATEAEAKEAKAELAGLGGDLSIEEQTADNDSDNAANEIDTEYIDMPYDANEETDTDIGDITGGCPSCGAYSDTIYRCSECGRDLAGIGIGGDRP